MKIIKSIIQKLKEYKDISYILPIMISALFAITQILSYYFRIGYLSYFDISKEFYNFNLFNDLMPIILSFFIISIIIIIIFVITNVMNTFFKNLFNNVLNGIDLNLKNMINLKNLIASLTLLFKNIKRNIKKNYTIKNILTIFIGSYIIILMSLGYFSLLMCGNINNIIGNTNALLFASLIISLIYTIIIKIKNKKEKIIENQKNKSYIEYILELIFVLLIIIIYFQNLGISAAKGQREFNIIENKFVLLYNSNGKGLVADFNYVESNGIIINTQNIKSIDLNNCTIKKQTFKKVYKE